LLLECKHEWSRNEEAVSNAHTELGHRNALHAISTIQGQFTAPLASLACVAFALLFFAGDVKGNQELAALPFDLTAGVFFVTLGLATLGFFARNGTIRTQVLWLLFLFLTVATALIWTEFTPYAIDKVVRFFTLSLAAALLPAFILTRAQDVRLFVKALIVLGALISVAALIQVFAGETVNGRIRGISADTITLGRNAGVALVGLYTMVSCGGKSKIWLAVLCLPLLLVLVASGSRGPTLFAVGVTAFVTIRWTRKSLRGTAIALALFISLVLAISHDPPLVPRLASDRIVQFIENRFDSSAEERVSAGRAAIHQIGNSPLGLGIAGFARVYSFGNVTNRVYPHNIVLEIAVEEGWIAGALFVVICVVGISRGYRAAVQDATLRPFFSILVFSLCNALVSGDMNDNRIVYALLCITLISLEIIKAGADNQRACTAELT